MSDDEKSDDGKADHCASGGKLKNGNEKAGNELSKAAFGSGKVGRKTISQGKRRESLKRWVKKSQS